MTRDRDIDRHRSQILELSRGHIEASKLPLEDAEFWSSVIQIGVRPGKTSNREPYLGSIVEHLLRAPLSPGAGWARASAARSALRSSSVRVRRSALLLLDDREVDDETLTALASAAKDSDKEVHLHAVRIIARQQTPAAIETLLEVLRDNSDFRSTLASETLVEAGDAAIPGLETLLDSDDEWIRWRATLCLAHIGSRKCLPALLRAFEDDSPNVAWVATDGLIALGPDVSQDVLRSVLASHLSNVTIRALHHYAEHIRPRGTFKELLTATAGSASGAATLTAIDGVLEKLTHKTA